MGRAGGLRRRRPLQPPLGGRATDRRTGLTSAVMGDLCPQIVELSIDMRQRVTKDPDPASPDHAGKRPVTIAEVAHV